MALMRVDGAPLVQLAADFSAAGPAAAVKISGEIQKAAYRIEAAGKVACPVATGVLRASISSTVTGMSAEIGPTARYGGFVENGTRRMAARPYMGPAADAEFPALEERVGRILGDII